MERELKPLSEGQLIVRVSTAPDRWSQDQGCRASSFKAGNFVKHSRKFLDCSFRPQLSSCLTQYPSTEPCITAKIKGYSSQGMKCWPGITH